MSLRESASSVQYVVMVQCDYAFEPSTIQPYNF